MPATLLESTAKTAGKEPVVAWLEMQGQSKSSAYALEKDMRLLVGTSSVCDVRVGGPVEGIIASLTSRGDDVILRVVGDAHGHRAVGFQANPFVASGVTQIGGDIAHFRVLKV